ncbi:MAG: lysophospholipid acyltransferase family protein [Coriobacteriia bacterium]|nr:lysophospholipid acyltransferase family protein [Coriobacteriia bacterium]
MSAPPLATPASGEGSVPWRLAHVLRATLAKVILVLYRTRFIGVENVPRDGGYVLAGNHVSYLDPVLLWCGVPKPTHFIARQDLFEAPVLRWLLPRVWTIPIKRATADREAIGRATALLKHGEPVGIFPEGTRQAGGVGAELGEAHSGVAFIATRADAPVVPVGISGTERALPRGAWFPRFPRVTISYGEPVRAEDFAELGRKERLDAMTAEIMRRIAEQRAVAEKG